MEKEFLAISQLISVARSVQELNFHFEKKYDLSLAQWLMLVHLKDMPGCSAYDLSEAFAVHPSSLTPALKRLKRKGLIVISEDPKDSRKKNLYLTREGREQMDFLTPKISPLADHLHLMSLQKMNRVLNGRESL